VAVFFSASVQRHTLAAAVADCVARLVTNPLRSAQSLSAVCSSVWSWRKSPAPIHAIARPIAPPWLAPVKDLQHGGDLAGALFGNTVEWRGQKNAVCRRMGR